METKQKHEYYPIAVYMDANLDIMYSVLQCIDCDKQVWSFADIMENCDV